MDDLTAAPRAAAVRGRAGDGRSRESRLARGDEALRVGGAGGPPRETPFFRALVVDADYGIEANEFALHSRVAAQPELGVAAEPRLLRDRQPDGAGLGLGRPRASCIRARHARAQAQVELSQTQRQLMSNLYSMYNEALTAQVRRRQHAAVADLAAESLRLTNLRYQAGESTALEVVDAQNTLVQARNALRRRAGALSRRARGTADPDGEFLTMHE